MTSADVIALSSLALNILVALVGLTWGVGKIRDATMGAINKQIEKLQTKVDVDIDSMARSFGETNSAIREKIREVELFGRDTFLRRDSFYKTMELISADMKTQFGKVESRLERMEAKIDLKT